MHFSAEVQDLPVIALSDGKEVGRVRDLIVDYHGGIVQGLVLEYGGIFQEARWIKMEDLVSIGRDALTIEEPGSVQVGLRSDYSQSCWLKRVEHQVTSVNGSDLGIIKDLVFDYPGAEVRGIELSGGLWADLDQGRKTVLWENVLTAQESGFLVDGDQENIWS